MAPDSTTQPAQSGRPPSLSRIAGSVTFEESGSPTLKISVNHRVVIFEDHPWCGLIAVNARTGEPLKRQPNDFLKAVTLWNQQGKLVEDGLCKWMHDAEPILKKVDGRWIVDGYKEPVQGE
jgi:hypothetical protein